MQHNVDLILELQSNLKLAASRCYEGAPQGVKAAGQPAVTAGGGCIHDPESKIAAHLPNTTSTVIAQHLLLGP